MTGILPASVMPRLSELLRDAAHSAILPRFRRLDDHEIEQKSPGEVVTIADREAERIIASGLAKLLPQARVVGEEACAADPELLRGLGDGLVWLVDPLDGTANFAEGRGPFAVMAALLRDGETLLSAMLDPVTGILCRAELGAGAYRDETRLRAHQDRAAPDAGAIATRFLPETLRDAVIARAAGTRLLPGLMCAGAEYPALVDGDRDFALFWRTLPWDHAPGALFLSEAGGAVMRWDGAPYRVAENGPGLLAARNSLVAEDVRRRIIGDATFFDK